MSYDQFGEQILHLTGLDLRSYKSGQMERRLKTIMHRYKVADYDAYVRLLTTDAGARQAFHDYITINVTEFFRNAEKFGELKTAIMPLLLQQRHELRIWSAGCSTGAEPYSVAMLLAELGVRRYDLIATDLDEGALAVAQVGEYSARELEGVDPLRLQRFFTTKAGDRFQVRPELQAQITFRRHNLLADPFPGDLDLILCRNVVIYFTDEVKDGLYRRFYESLRPGGVLFVGGTESILNARTFGYQLLQPFFYQRPLPAATALR